MVAACSALSVVLGAANYSFWQRRAAAAQQHEIVRRNGEFMLRSLTNRTRIEADLAALREAVAHVDRNLLQEASMEVNLGYFYRLEKANRVRLVRLNQLISPTPPAGSPFKAVPFSMLISGSYRNCMSFLRALETGPRLLRIRNCSFERSGADNSDLTLELTVDVLAKS